MLVSTGLSYLKGTPRYLVALALANHILVQRKARAGPVFEE